MPVWIGFSLVEWCLIAMLALFLPLAVFFGRGSVRQRRLTILDNLEAAARRAMPDHQQVEVPLLALVRARYAPPVMLGPDGRPDAHANLRRAVREVLAYAVSSASFVMLCLAGFYLLLGVGRSIAVDPGILLQGLSEAAAGSSEAAAYRTVTALVVGAAFLGAYVWSINYLILRVANYDLSPLDWLRVSVHLLLTCLVAGVFRHVVAVGTGLELAAAFVLLAAFLMGMFPSLGLSALADRLPPSFRLKRIVPEGDRIAREFPLDLIDGIDAGIRFRLAAYEIDDAQNLATENPLSLYVGTPYNLFQIMDWIARAQLLVAVGPARYLALRERNLSDIHALLAIGETEAGRAFLAPVLFDGVPPDQVPDEVIVRHLAALADSLHVRRLRALTSFLGQTMDPPARPGPIAPIRPTVVHPRSGGHAGT
ncbi:MAG TPA: hypothetical protein VNS22_07685 [Geminicoccus sp.]|uniref:hypothetical protein n=1 Tax=Geminicoccus sp. TaxID=2024832 RepID=UPI002B8ABAC1|nr:hypothetical protein [Geminicoccus sp.]HWL68253.1 hypothetical protein [Geminicoccus sp.]